VDAAAAARLLIPVGILHEVHILSELSMRTVYIEAGVAVLRPRLQGTGSEPAVARADRPCWPSPSNLRSMAVATTLAHLILSELAGADAGAHRHSRPRDRRTVAVCSAIMDAPGSRRSIEDWAHDAGASARTLIRLFPEAGLHYRQWLQQVPLAEGILPARQAGAAALLHRLCSGLPASRLQRHVPPHPRAARRSIALVVRGGEQRAKTPGLLFFGKTQVFARDQAVGQRSQQGTDDGCQPEQPQLAGGPVAHVQRHAGAAGRVDGGVGDGNADQVNQGQGQADRQRRESGRCAPVGGTQDDDQKNIVRTISMTSADSIE
jgi:AraC-like DNA-binding protein